MTTIKAIETIYNGFRFRSRLEARWAVFFDALGIEYEYEKEGFDLGELGYYLPDFYINTEISNTGWFVEVKGDPSDLIGIKKAQKLDDYPPDYAWGCLFAPNIKDIERIKLFLQALGKDPTHRELKRAIEKFKQARFEHGEQG